MHKACWIQLPTKVFEIRGTLHLIEGKYSIYAKRCRFLILHALIACMLQEIAGNVAWL
jgi:hypothetical protein